MMLEEIRHGLVNIGERITEAREKQDLTVRDLAGFTGVTEDEVRNWGASDSRPVLWQVLELAARCEVTPDWLLGRDLIEEVFVDESKRYYVCLRPGANPFEIPLDDPGQLTDHRDNGTSEGRYGVCAPAAQTPQCPLAFVDETVPVQSPCHLLLSSLTVAANG